MKNKKVLIIVLAIWTILFYTTAFFVIKSLLNKKISPELTNTKDIEYATNLKLKASEFDENADYDYDELLNYEELEHGTDCQLYDTDSDGLSDGEEIYETNTNPLLYDTDGDGFGDGLEIELGLDPLNKSTDGVNDKDRTFDISYNIDTLTLNISGNANVGNTYIGTLGNINVKNMPGVVSKLYEFYLDDSFDSATIEFEYDDKYISSLGYDEENLKLYQFTDDCNFIEVGGTIDTDKNILTCELKHFSKYVVADSNKLNNQSITDVFILLDNSGSMYPEEKCPDSEENDVDFKRVDMAKKLISMTDETIRYGLAKFTGTYTSLAEGFDNSKEDLYNKLESIKTEDEVFDGTYIANSIKDALNNFDKTTNNDRKFIILLTDGRTTEGGFWDWSLYDEDNAIADANKKNVSIIIIGLGQSVDTDYLIKIANQTGGFYVYANDADALDRIYETLIASLNYGYIDLDEDGVNDHILLADTGFDVTKNGWNFKNFFLQVDGELVNGQCAGLAAIAQLYYLGKLPLIGDAVEKYQSTGLWFINRTYLQSDAYDISEVNFFQDKNNLANFEFLPGWNNFASKKLGLLLYQDQDNATYFKLNDDMEEFINNTDIIKTYTVDAGDNIYVNGKQCKSYEQYYYDLDVDYDNLSDSDKEAYKTLMAIHNWYSRQSLDSEYIEYDLLGMTISESFENEHSVGVLNGMIDALNNGIALVVSGEGHAVNALRIYRSIVNPLEYTIICYDNNTPNTEKSITLKLSVKRGLDKVDMQGWKNTYNFSFIDNDNIYQNGAGAGITIKFKDFTKR